jgi:hypothetical protein
VYEPLKSQSEWVWRIATQTSRTGAETQIPFLKLTSSSCHHNQVIGSYLYVPYTVVCSFLHLLCVCSFLQNSFGLLGSIQSLLICYMSLLYTKILTFVQLPFAKRIDRWSFLKILPSFFWSTPWSVFFILASLSPR